MERNNNGKGMFYGVLAVATLVVAIIGATFANFSATDTDDSTFKGRTNNALRYLKSHYPDKQIILMTPIHRGYAKFNEGNIQPDEAWANEHGLFIDDYVQAVKEAGNVWAVPVIDLNSISGLYPVMDEHAPYFRKADTDRLHPNTPGHLRMAYAILYQMLALPASFEPLSK